MSAERINLLQFRIGFLKQSKLGVAVHRLELQLTRALELHGTIRSELLALLFVLHAAGGWTTRVPISEYHDVPDDAGSFWALVIGLFFLVIRQWAWLARQEMLVTQRIVMMRRHPSDQPLERTSGPFIELV